jgi:hypothetical protein
MDDITAVGSVECVLGVYDRLATALERVGCSFNRYRVETKFQVPMGDLMIRYLARPREESWWSVATSRLLGAERLQ